MPNSQAIVPYQPQPPAPYYPPYQPPIIYTGGGKSGNTALTLGIVVLALVGGGFALWYVLRSKGKGQVRLVVTPVNEEVEPGEEAQVSVDITNIGKDTISPRLRLDLKKGLTWQEGTWTDVGELEPEDTTTITLSRTVPSDWTVGAINAQIVMEGTNGEIWSGQVFSIPAAAPGQGVHVDRDASHITNTSQEVAAGESIGFEIHWANNTNAPKNVQWLIQIRNSGIAQYSGHQVSKTETLPANSGDKTTALSIAVPGDWDGDTVNLRVLITGGDDTGDDKIFESPPDFYILPKGEPPTSYTIDSAAVVGDILAGGIATVEVNITNNTIGTLKKSFVLGMTSPVVIVGTTKSVNIPTGSSQFTLTLNVPSTPGATTVTLVIKDVTVASNPIKVWESEEPIIVIGYSQLSPLKDGLGNTYLLVSKTPTDGKVAIGGALSVTLGVYHIGAAQSYKFGTYIKAPQSNGDAGYWIQGTFQLPQDTTKTKRTVTIPGTLHTTLASGRKIDIYNAVCETSQVLATSGMLIGDPDSDVFTVK